MNRRMASKGKKYDLNFQLNQYPSLIDLDSIEFVEV